MCSLSARFRIRQIEMDTKSHKTVWNRVKNFTLFSSLPYTFIHSHRTIRRISSNAPKWNVITAQPLVTAFHITFNYYCIKRTTRVFPMTWMPPKMKIRWIRARIYILHTTRNQTSNHIAKWTKKRGFRVSGSSGCLNHSESATYRILPAGSMCESKYWRLICKLRYSDYSIIWIYFEGEHRTQKLCVAFQENVPFQNETNRFHRPCMCVCTK